MGFKAQHPSLDDSERQTLPFVSGFHVLVVVGFKYRMPRITGALGTARGILLPTMDGGWWMVGKQAG